ncbi:polysaccharide biosynthesis protein GtrA [Bacteroidia bacterium]|nr:polysaccharide biosynthesis protein GtrA [Bacteroidia bacterium]
MPTVFLLKFVKFCIVGGSGVLVDFGTTWLLKEKVRLNRYLANACGFLLAASSNYLLNRLWTFASQNPHIAAEYMTFVAIALVGLGINSLVIWLLSDKWGWQFYFSKIVATGAVTLWNFAMNYWLTF